MTEISVITVVYRPGPVLWRALPALLAQQGLGELIVVINGATQEEHAFLAAQAMADPRVRLLHPGRNLGFAAGCNHGAAAARGDLIALVNPDCVLEPATLIRVAELLAAQPGAWIAGARLLNLDGSEQRGSRRETPTPWRAFVEVARLDRIAPGHPYFRRMHQHETAALDHAAPMPTVSGAFMMLPHSAWERLGGMDERLFLHFDDVDLCLRAQQQGGEVWYAGHVGVPHVRSSSDAARLFVEWHKTRSAVRYFGKHFRTSYPGWVLGGIAACLWLRFAALAAWKGPGDLVAAVGRHWRRRDR